LRSVFPDIVAMPATDKFPLAVKLLVLKSSPRVAPPSILIEGADRVPPTNRLPSKVPIPTKVDTRNSEII